MRSLSRVMLPLLLGGMYLSAPAQANNLLNDYDKLQRELYTKSHGCDTPGDDSQILIDALETHDHVQIPANVGLQVANVPLGAGKRISGPGIICKRADADSAFVVTGNEVTIDNMLFDPLYTGSSSSCDIRLAEGVSEVRINDNNFRGAANSYAAICGADPATGYVDHANSILVSGNFFNGYFRPVYLHSVDNITIQGNILRESQFDGIHIRANNGYAIVNSNQFADIGQSTDSTETRSALYTEWTGQKLILSDNIIRNTSQMGFDIKGVAQQGTGESHNILVANNQISGTAHSAVFFHGDFATGIPSNSLLIEGNVIADSSTSGELGNSVILIEGKAKYITIGDNQLMSNTNRGITVQTYSGEFDGTIKGVQIVGNTLVNNGISGVDGSIGIDIHGVDSLVLTNNMLANDPTLPNPEQKYGIYVAPQATSVGAIIRDNVSRCHAGSNITTVGRTLLATDNVEITTGCI